MPLFEKKDCVLPMSWPINNVPLALQLPYPLIHEGN